MSTGEPPTFLARLARRPLPILLGVAVGFLACCVAGRVAARQQPYKNFVRFHPHIAPDSHYRPPFEQVLNLARQHAAPGKVLVIIGGNSVMHGVGQRAEHIWTRHLQERLGDRYAVLNLAMRAAWSNEFGGFVAERLSADGVPVLYVTIGTENVGWSCDWDGGVYREFFWDAWGKGLVPPDPRRDAWLAEGFYAKHAAPEGDETGAQRRAREAAREKSMELRKQGQIDGATYANDLWTYVADRYRGTVWTPLKYPNFWKPHRSFKDSDPGDTLPFEAFHNERTLAVELDIVRGRFRSAAGQALLRGDPATARAVGEQFAAFVPDLLRAKTLYVLRIEGRYYLNRLPANDRRDYYEVSRRYRDAVRAAGIDVVLAGENYEERDYSDRSHLGERGGAKLAADLEPTVRAMAERQYPDLFGGNRQ